MIDWSELGNIGRYTVVVSLEMGKILVVEEPKRI